MVSSCNTAQYTSSDDGDDEEGQRVYKPEENDYEVGGDPGGKDIVTLALPGKANDKGRYREQRFHKLSLSRARYYRESGINKARMHTNKWSKDVRDALNDLSKTSPKGSRLDHGSTKPSGIYEICLEYLRDFCHFRPIRLRDVPPWFGRIYAVCSSVHTQSRCAMG